MDRQIVATESAPAAIGPYSQAVKSGEFVFTSGQIPIAPETGKVIEGGIIEQTTQVMANMRAVLAEAGASFADVLKSTVFLDDIGEFAQFNEVYGSYFGDEPPARSTVQVAALPLGVKVEIEMVARTP